MAKYTELFAEYLKSGGELPAAVVTSRCNETIIEAIKDEAYEQRAWVHNSCPCCFPRAFKCEMYLMNVKGVCN